MRTSWRKQISDGFKIAALFSSLYRRMKSAAISKLADSLIPSNCSNNFLDSSSYLYTIQTYEKFDFKEFKPCNPSYITLHWSCTSNGLIFLQSCILLELRHYKNNSIQPKNVLELKLPHCFVTYMAGKKSAALSKLESFLTKVSRSYIVLPLQPF